MNWGRSSRLGHFTFLYIYSLIRAFQQQYNVPPSCGGRTFRCFNHANIRNLLHFYYICTIDLGLFMKKSSFITAIMAAMIMIAPSKMSAQEDNGFKKFSVEEAFEDNGFQWFRDAQLLCAGNKEKSNAMTIVWGQVYNEGQLRQFSKQLKMQKIQSAFNQLAKEHHDEIMQMRRERNRAGLQELQDKLAAEAEAQVTGEGLTEEQRTIYSTIGGTPHLDGQYTVFGEVEEGLDVVEMIQQTATARGDRPVDDIEMRMILVD